VRSARWGSGDAERFASAAMKITSGNPVTRAYTAKGAASPSSAARGAGAAAASGASDVTAIMGIPENEFTPRVRAAIMTLMAEVDRLRQDLDATKSKLEAVQAQADRDVLLPVLNRRAFVRELSRMLAFSERYSVPVALIYLDLNGFKPINDSYGHPAGDAALVHICEIIAHNIRESDILGRLGGDEFGLILPKADMDTAQRKALALHDRLRERPFAWHGVELPVTFAHGVTVMQSGQTATDAIAAADQAMYRAKRARAEAAE
jgi:diguanylate cyclase (GGDEF)-like protein